MTQEEALQLQSGDLICNPLDDTGGRLPMVFLRTRRHQLRNFIYIDLWHPCHGHRSISVVTYPIWFRNMRRWS